MTIISTRTTLNQIEPRAVQVKLLGMADRVSIDIEGLRDRINTIRTDPAWQELSLSKKVRALLQQQLEQLEQARVDQKSR